MPPRTSQVSASYVERVHFCMSTITIKFAGHFLEATMTTTTVEPLKTCSQCFATKPIAQFRKQGPRRGG